MADLAVVLVGADLTQTLTMSPLKIVRYCVVKAEHKEQGAQTAVVAAQRSVR
jgi:hypothetical protein